MWAATQLQQEPPATARDADEDGATAEVLFTCLSCSSTVTLQVANTGDRPIQVGSHCHFFEVNRALQFDREQAYGFRLQVPAGTAVRFEPGEAKHVTLVAIGGNRVAYGINGLTHGRLDDPQVRQQALAKAKELGFLMKGTG